jgi:hypothetical protein
VELKRDAIPRVVLNQLYKHSTMQSTFGVIMLALVPDPTSGRLVPKVMPLKTVLEHYIAHRHEVIVRRTQFDLDKALEREHILEGLKIAVDNIDEVIRIIRAASDTPVASAQLQQRFKLSERQAEAILNMRLAKLTGLEIEKLDEELAEVRATIADLRDILASRPRRMQIMKDELAEIATKYGDERRSEITSDEGEFTIEDLIAEEDMVVTISHAGYIKRTPVTTYRRQRRGGRGASGADLKETDFIERLFIGSTHDYLMIFTDDGRCFWLKVHEIPQAGRATRGKPIVNLINTSPETQIRAIVPVREFREDQFLLFCTRAGTVKKSRLSEYGNVRSTGIKAIKIESGDALIDVQVTSGSNDIVLATKHGLSIRFPEAQVREMGRDTTGVKGVELRPEDRVVSMVVVRRADATLLVVTEKGMGKVTDLTEYRVQNRGGKGIITQKITDKTGMVVSLMEMVQDDEIMLITKQGVIIRSGVNEVRNTGRNAQGVRLVNLDANDVVCSVACVRPEPCRARHATAPRPRAITSADDRDHRRSARRARDARRPSGRRRRAARRGGPHPAPARRRARARRRPAVGEARDAAARRRVQAARRLRVPRRPRPRGARARRRGAVVGEPRAGGGARGPPLRRARHGRDADDGHPGQARGCGAPRRDGGAGGDDDRRPDGARRGDRGRHGRRARAALRPRDDRRRAGHRGAGDRRGAAVGAAGARARGRRRAERRGRGGGEAAVAGHARGRRGAGHGAQAHARPGRRRARVPRRDERARRRIARGAGGHRPVRAPPGVRGRRGDGR